MLIHILDLSGSHPHRGRVHQCLYRILPTPEIASPSAVVPQHDSR